MRYLIKGTEDIMGDWTLTFYNEDTGKIEEETIYSEKEKEVEENV